MEKSVLKSIAYSAFLISFVAIVSCVLMQDHLGHRSTQSVNSVHESDFYSREVQPIFNQRCIACHSCLESPCQLNLQTYDGVKRGGIQGSLVYNGVRTTEAPLTRMYQDGHTVQDWRAMGFYDIIGDVQNSIFLYSLKLGMKNRQPPNDEVRKNQICAKDMKSFNFQDAEIKMAMPYGLPGLSSDHYKVLSEWVAMGAPGPIESEIVPSGIVEIKNKWEEFLNQKDLKTQFVSRYLYEHLFLAHFYFDAYPRYFLRLIRSSTRCDAGPTVIATRRPNDSPGVSEWFYCFEKVKGVTVDKTHIPYKMSLAKLAWLKKNFMNIPWQPDSKLDFSPEVASNPFKAFRSIPVSARYRFLLEDAFYHINTFIKGPVCNGTNAVNSIQEQFYTFFIHPDSDLMALSSEYSNQVVDQLALPGKWGSQVEIQRMLGDYQSLINERNQYRLNRGIQLKNIRPNGLTLNDIWDGDGRNDNAVLTIIRHGGNARVVKGALGDLSKTAFMLDYSLFERLVYNLVVNFDVYGNVGHQFLTRVYMDLVRMEAENNFLDFFPISDRVKVKETWYQGFLTKYKLNIFDEQQFSPIPAGIKYTSESNVQLELVRKILFERLNAQVRGRSDLINWKVLQKVDKQNPEQSELSKLVSKIATKYAPYFPEASLLFITESGIPRRAYSIIHNRQLKNVSWIMFEEQRLDPEQSSLLIAPGYLSSYPNQFFSVESKELSGMVNAILAISNQADFNEFINKYAISRMDQRIWTFYDFANEDFAKNDPVNAGYLDLSRYILL
ncbi:MAG: fatty acid cis/trans isomerase [Bdellovibrionaceae bacterium]|nr:fatty acid cis/trans isomerase [Pseudobdellovibrionaceae bacterium]